MIRAAIEKILSLAVPQIITVGERPYSSAQIHPVLDPRVTPLEVRTLTAVEDYFERNPDGIVPADMIVHVESPEEISIFDAIDDPFMTRQKFIFAKAALHKFNFASFMSTENFIIAMQTMFVQNETTRQIVTRWNDDGVTQKVSAKVAIVRVEEIPVPSPVTLRPFRTFLELDQPASAFIFRIKRQEGQQPVCALFEADGGAWELEAINSIANWLRGSLPLEVTILA
jgi:hypothetical protein